jgi:hypothetical protein
MPPTIFIPVKSKANRKPLLDSIIFEKNTFKPNPIKRTKKSDSHNSGQKVFNKLTKIKLKNQTKYPSPEIVYKIIFQQTL